MSIVYNLLAFEIQINKGCFVYEATLIYLKF